MQFFVANNGHAGAHFVPALLFQRHPSHGVPAPAIGDVPQTEGSCRMGILIQQSHVDRKKLTQ